MSSANQKLDKKTEMTFRTMENLKASQNGFAEIMRAASNYAKQAQKLSEAGRALTDALTKASQVQNGDLQQGVTRLADVFRTVEAKRDMLAKTMSEDLVNNISRLQKPDESELNAFKNDYEKARTNVRTQIAKLEANTKKAGKSKGGPSQLQTSIQQLNEKIKEAEVIKADKLRAVLLLERKRYCNFLASWGSTVNAEMDYLGEVHRFQENQQFWGTLASTPSQLPPDLEDVIKSSQERTFVSIQASGEIDDYGSSWGGNFDSNSSASFYDAGNSYQPPAQSYGYNSGYDNHGYGSSAGFCTALYDFAGQESGDLSFYAGDVIAIVQDDDGSGWIKGELNGMQGIFPSTYVQRN